MKVCKLYAQNDLRYEEAPDPKISDDAEIIVAIKRGGICGSDMHYYQEGGVGSIRVREPLVIGHEGCGVVLEVGGAVAKAKPGDMVAIRPARPCFKCLHCDRGMFSYCEAMRHLGSAALLPHTGGLFAERVVLHESQVCVVNGASSEVMAFAEPLGVAYSAVRKLGDLMGRSVLVMGAGPIGALSAVAAKSLGAGMTAIVDVRQHPLDLVRRMGIDMTVNGVENKEQIESWKAHKGFFDFCIEATGSAAAAADGMAMTRPEGVVSQVGSFAPGKAPQDLGAFATKGITWRSSFRFYDEFVPAVDALQSGRIDPLPLLSQTFPMQECVAAMKAALSPETAKVQIIISE